MPQGAIPGRTRFVKTRCVRASGFSPYKGVSNTRIEFYIDALQNARSPECRDSPAATENLITQPQDELYARPRPQKHPQRAASVDAKYKDPRIALLRMIFHELHSGLCIALVLFHDFTD